MGVKNYLNSLPRRTKMLMGITMMVVIVWFYYLQIITPFLKKESILSNDIARLNVQVEELQTRLNVVSGQAGEYERVKEEYNRTRERLEMAREKLPKGENLSEFLRQVTNTSKSGTAVLDSMSPLPPESSEEYIKLPLKILLKGDYNSLTGYLEYLEKLPRLITVASINLEQKDINKRMLAAHISGATYVVNK